MDSFANGDSVRGGPSLFGDSASGKACDANKDASIHVFDRVFISLMLSRLRARVIDQAMI